MHFIFRKLALFLSFGVVCSFTQTFFVPCSCVSKCCKHQKARDKTEMATTKQMSTNLHCQCLYIHPVYFSCRKMRALPAVLSIDTLWPCPSEVLPACFQKAKHPHLEVGLRSSSMRCPCSRSAVSMDTSSMMTRSCSNAAAASSFS